MSSIPAELLEEVIEGLTPAMERAAHRLVPWCAEDGAAEARLEMVEAAEKFDLSKRAGKPPRDALSAYMFRVGQQAILRVADRGYGRLNNRRYHWPEEVAVVSDPLETLERVPDPDDPMAAMVLLGSLPAYSQTTVAHLAKGYTQRDTAAFLRTSRSTVSLRLKAARVAAKEVMATG